MDFLLNHTYQGNIREMKNLIERLLVLSENGRILKTSIPSLSKSEVQSAIEIEEESNEHVKQLTLKDIKPLKEVRQELEMEYIKQALVLCKYNVSEAARKLDLSRRQLYNKMNQYNL